MIESLKLIKVTTFDQNQFMTFYLIFNFRPTYFSYFQKKSLILILEALKNRWNKLIHPHSQGVSINQNVNNILDHKTIII